MPGELPSLGPYATILTKAGSQITDKNPSLCVDTRDGSAKSTHAGDPGAEWRFAFEALKMAALMLCFVFWLPIVFSSCPSILLPIPTNMNEAAQIVLSDASLSLPAATIQSVALGEKEMNVSAPWIAPAGAATITFEEGRSNPLPCTLPQKTTLRRLRIAHSFPKRYSSGPWDAVVSLRYAALVSATMTAGCAYNATQPPEAPIIESVHSDEDGSLTVIFNTPAGTAAGWKEAMVIDGTNQSMWQYESPHWTSPALLDDGINKKSEYFNRAANRIKAEVHYGGGVRSVVWSHGLGKSLQQIFSSGEFVASEVSLEDWHGILGDGVAGWDKLCNMQGFNLHLGIRNDVLPGGARNFAARFGLLMSQIENVCFQPESIIGVGLHGLDRSSPRVNHFPAAGASATAFSDLSALAGLPAGGGNRTEHIATKVVLYVDNGACTSYSIATTTSAHATVASSSPATVTGLQPMTAYVVSVHAINAASTSPAVAAPGTFRPCTAHAASPTHRPSPPSTPSTLARSPSVSKHQQTRPLAAS
jgi:hypothetical protein